MKHRKKHKMQKKHHRKVTRHKRRAAYKKSNWNRIHRDLI